MRVPNVTAKGQVVVVGGNNELFNGASSKRTNGAKTAGTSQDQHSKQGKVQESSTPAFSDSLKI